MKIIVPPRYKKVRDFEEAHAWVLSGNKAEYIDRTGQLVIHAKFDFGGHFHEGLAWVASGGKLGYISSDGNLVVKMDYEFETPGVCGNFIEGRAFVIKKF